MNDNNTHDNNVETTLLGLAQSLRRTRGIMGVTDVPLDPTPTRERDLLETEHNGWVGSIVRIDFNDGSIMIAAKSCYAERVAWGSFASAKDLNAGDSYCNGIDENLESFADTVMQAASEAFAI